MSGTKFDQGKPDLTMISRTFAEQVAEVMMFGANKYGRNNYLKGMPVLRLLAAAQRHIKAYEDGEDVDPESNLNHLAHAAANLNMIMNLNRHGKLEDNRYRDKLEADISTTKVHKGYKSSPTEFEKKVIDTLVAVEIDNQKKAQETADRSCECYACRIDSYNKEGNSK